VETAEVNCGGCRSDRAGVHQKYLDGVGRPSAAPVRSAARPPPQYSIDFDDRAIVEHSETTADDYSQMEEPVFEY